MYKPIQIAEILYRDRINGDIDLQDLKTYKIASRKWRDIICLRFLGRTSASSVRYQDDVFSENVIPPLILHRLSVENRKKNGLLKTIYTNASKNDIIKFRVDYIIVILIVKRILMSLILSIYFGMNQD